MPIDYQQVMSFPAIEARARHTVRDTLLYALGVGTGAEEPTAASALAFVYEAEAKALPTMAVVMATPGFWLTEPRYAFDWKQVLHTSQGLVLHRPLPVVANLKSITVIDDIIDKGKDRGALLLLSSKLYDEADNGLLASLSQSFLLRGDGGFTAKHGGERKALPQSPAMPERAPDISVELQTRRDQSLLYRLSGDYNPLHIDPVVATSAGFERPVLHGLCTYGFAGRALVQTVCAGDPARLKRLDVRFTRPVFPGDTLRVEVWREGEGKALFRVMSNERDAVVIDNGVAEFC